MRVPGAPQFRYLGGDGVDHILGRGFTVVGRSELPARGRLSDHAAVIACIVAHAGDTGG